MRIATTNYVPEQELQQAQMLAWSTGLGAVTPQALAEREQVPIAIASERLDEAVQSGLMDKHSLLTDYPSLYTVSAEGRRLARKHAGAGGYASPKGAAVSRVGIKDMRHMIACAGVTAALERRYPDHRVIGERELRRDERDAGRKLASVEIEGPGRRRSHLPDIVIWPPATPEGPAPLPVAVEVELTKKTREELLDNLRAWARCRTIEGVVYYAETTKVEEQLLDAIEELRVEDMIVVNPLSEIVGSLPGFHLTPWEPDEPSHLSTDLDDESVS